MNKYVNQMKQAVLDYQGTARRIADQQAQNRETLVEALASAENTTLALELQEAEAKAQKQIQAALDIVSGGLGKAVPLSGKDVTEDVQLLSCAFDLSREQLQELVEKHRNNPTMLNAIMKYTQNHGIHGVQVPTAAEKLEAYKVFANGAWGMLRTITTDPHAEITGLDTWGEVPTSSERLVSLVGSGDEI